MTDQQLDYCADNQHDWETEYYGTRCKKCGLFYPDGGAPWDDMIFLGDFHIPREGATVGSDDAAHDDESENAVLWFCPACNRGNVTYELPGEPDFGVCPQCGSNQAQRIEQYVQRKFAEMFPPGSDGPDENFDIGLLYELAEQAVAEEDRPGPDEPEPGIE